MNKIKKFVFIISFFIISFGGYLAVHAQSQESNNSNNNNISFIVNANNPITEISKETVALYYLKKVKFWPNNQSVRFFDRGDESTERTYFLSNFLSMSPREVDSFWIGQKLYSGDSAPTQVNDDNTMVRLVSKFPESIGYVSPGFVEAKGVKKITIIGK